jgi:hypothetical protein
MKHIIPTILFNRRFIFQLAYKSWIPKWEKNKWKTSNNKDVENKGLFQRLMKLIRARNAEVTIVMIIPSFFISHLSGVKISFF